MPFFIYQPFYSFRQDNNLVIYIRKTLYFTLFILSNSISVHYRYVLLPVIKQSIAHATRTYAIKFIYYNRYAIEINTYELENL